jgi:hypothetical protein
MQKTLIYIDVRSKSQVRATGSWATTADYPTLERGQWQVLCVQFVDRVVDTSGVVTLVPADMSLAASYLLVGDNNFEDEDGLMFKSMQSTVPFNSTDPETNRFNIDGDWVSGEFKDGDWVTVEGATTADLAKGQLSVRINTDTEKFNSVLNGKERVQSGLYINIKQVLPGLETPCTVAWFKFVAVNTLRDYTGALEEVPAGISVIPFIDSALRNPMEVQFAGEDLNWHTEQRPDDVYWRFRLANTSTQWSTVIKLPAGTAAGGTSVAMMLYGAETSPGTINWVPAEYVTPENLGDAYDVLVASLTHIRFIYAVDGEAVEGPALKVKGNPGDDGHTPEKGVDYYTESDKEALLTELKDYVDNSIANGEW